MNYLFLRGEDTFIMRKIKIFLLLIFSLTFFSCSKNYEQPISCCAGYIVNKKDKVVAGYWDLSNNKEFVSLGFSLESSYATGITQHDGKIYICGKKGGSIGYWDLSNNNKFFRAGSSKDTSVNGIAFYKGDIYLCGLKRGSASNLKKYLDFKVGTNDDSRYYIAGYWNVTEKSDFIPISISRNKLKVESINLLNEELVISGQNDKYSGIRNPGYWKINNDNDFVKVGKNGVDGVVYNIKNINGKAFLIGEYTDFINDSDSVGTIWMENDLKKGIELKSVRKAYDVFNINDKIYVVGYTPPYYGYLDLYGNKEFIKLPHKFKNKISLFQPKDEKCLIFGTYFVPETKLNKAAYCSFDNIDEVNILSPEYPESAIMTEVITVQNK